MISDLETDNPDRWNFHVLLHDGFEPHSFPQLKMPKLVGVNEY